MNRTFYFSVVLLFLIGCSSPELPPHNFSDDIVEYSLAAPDGFDEWSDAEKQEWRQIVSEYEESKRLFETAVEVIGTVEIDALSAQTIKLDTQISEFGDNLTRGGGPDSELASLEKQKSDFLALLTEAENKYEETFRPLINDFKKTIYKFQINVDKFLSKVKTEVKQGEDDDRDDPTDTDPPTIYGEEIDPTTLTGYEVFINIGGVLGSTIENQTQASLEAGYQRHGFRVNTFVKAMKWEPIQKRMEYVASVYKENNVELKYVVFHHGGHGWRDKIGYETTVINSLGQKQKKRGTPTQHSKIFATLGNTFPKSDPQFPNTKFGVVLDACGQGNAVDRRVTGRNGFVATSTPAFRWYHLTKGETYYYSGTYIYSSYFGNFLHQTNPATDPDSKTAVLRSAHNSANQQTASSAMGNGEYKAY